MAEYMAQRIIEGAYTYSYVVGRRPDLKSGIDSYLTAKGYEGLIVQ